MRDERSRLILKNRRAPLMKIFAAFNASNDFIICKRTFDRYCRRNGFIRGPSGIKQVLKERHRKCRLEWCKPRRFWTMEDNWSNIIFSDERMVKVGENHRVYIWKRKGEGYRPELYWEKENSIESLFKVMIRGCITWNGVGTLCFVDGNITAEKYMKLLEENLWPVIARHFSYGGTVFQDDEAPIHTARIVKSWKQNNAITNPSLGDLTAQT